MNYSFNADLLKLTFLIIDKLKDDDDYRNRSSSSKSSPLSAVAPYRYFDETNIYICNLCNFTYDSLRSIKAHLWKHAGHHDLSYPLAENHANGSTSKSNFHLKLLNKNKISILI